MIVRTRAAGIRLGIDRPPIGGVKTVVRRNLVRGGGDDAFRVARGDRLSLLRGNIARNARDDGSDVESRSTKLTSNRAVRNADLGIEAVRGGDRRWRKHRPIQRRPTPVHANLVLGGPASA